MNNNNNTNARSRASRKRARAAGNAPAPGTQPSIRKPGKGKGRQRKRAARNGRAQTNRGGAISDLDQTTVWAHGAPVLDDILEKDEFVTDILGSNGTGNISIQKFAVNPGQAALFPLGSPEANKWTCWKMISCVPYLKREVSEFATDGSTGKVILAMDYNAANDAPTTKQQLEDMHCATAMPCQDIQLPLVPSLCNKADPKYIRTGVKPAGTDIRLYDGGNLYVATAGQAGNSKVSELHVRYKFQLCLPTLLNPTGGLSDDSVVSQFVTTGIATGATSETGGATGVATNMLVAGVVGNGLGAVNTAGSIVPPAGDYRVTADAYVGNGGGTDIDGLQLQIKKNGTSIMQSVNNNANGVSDMAIHTEVLVQCNGTDALTFPLTTTYSGGVNDVWGSVILQLV